MQIYFYISTKYPNMCGICSYISYKSNTPSAVLNNMVSTLDYRGPDDQGTYVNNNGEAEIGMGQARLAVIDLSINGHQPMHFEYLTIVFNGEIYNYQEIRKELQHLGNIFSTNTDTEVILQAHAVWGENAVQHFIGMFSYIIFDSNQYTLTIYRDRAGIKPLYYYQTEDLLLFASELKSFHQHPHFKKEIDKGALTLFFKLGYIPAPHSIFKNVYKLEAGHFLTYKINTRKSVITQYWSLNDQYKKPVLKIDYEEAKVEVEKLLKSACEYRMIADVPVGIFLSGGYDSTAVTTILQKDSTEKLNTFTIGFDEGLDEVPFAKAIAQHLGTDHSEMYCTAKDAKEIIPTLPHFYDEPFADISAIPMMLVSQFAKKTVTVALSADGGDEVFAGYAHYATLSKYVRQIDNIPTVLKGSTYTFATGLKRIIPAKFVGAQHRLNAFVSSVKLEKNRQVAAMYEAMSYFPASYIQNLLLEPVDGYATSFEDDFSGFTQTGTIALAIDYTNFLQNDILTKVDRATMSVSLEGREPLLDHRLAEFVARLPSAYKNDGLVSKKILKDIVYQYVPKELLDRPKNGFDPPIYNWLRTDCSDLLSHYFSEANVKKSGLLNEKFVTEIKILFLAKKLHYTQMIWRILMFQMWFEQWMN